MSLPGNVDRHGHFDVQRAARRFRANFGAQLVYANQRRSIIAIEKGAPGERAFNEAFTTWGQ